MNISLKRHYNKLPEYNHGRKDEADKHSSCGASELECIPDARYEDGSKINDSKEWDCDYGEPSVVMRNVPCRGKEQPIQVEPKGKEDYRKNEHDMHHIAHSHYIVEHRAEWNVKIGVKIRQHVSQGSFTKEEIREEACCNVNSWAESQWSLHNWFNLSLVLQLIVDAVNCTSMQKHVWYHRNEWQKEQTKWALGDTPL